MNLSARLEALNKDYGTEILIDAATVAQLPDVPLREIGHIAVRGFSEPVAVFTPLEKTGEVLQKKLEAPGITFGTVTDQRAT